MRRMARPTVMFLLLAVIAVGTLTLLSTPTEARNGWTKCPSVPCMLPCIQDPVPTVACKAPGGGVILTDFANCCCCGLGTKWRPL